MGAHSATEVEFIDGEPATIHGDGQILPVGKAEVDFQKPEPVLVVAPVEVPPAVDPYAESESDEDEDEDDGDEDPAADLDDTDYDLP